MEKILISACLIGDKCKYDGKSNYCPDITKLLENHELVPFCPEVEGGLGIPRSPSEIKGDKVINKKGDDVTEKFLSGAEKALNICVYLGIKKAVLKENSPSCGIHHIYNGNFNNVLIENSGITARLLKENGIKVYSENEIDLLLEEENKLKTISDEEYSKRIIEAKENKLRKELKEIKEDK